MKIILKIYKISPLGRLEYNPNISILKEGDIFGKKNIINILKKCDLLGAKGLNSPIPFYH